MFVDRDDRESSHRKLGLFGSVFKGKSRSLYDNWAGLWLPIDDLSNYADCSARFDEMLVGKRTLLHLHLTSPLMVFHRNSLTPICLGNLEWRAYQGAEKEWWRLQPFWLNTRMLQVDWIPIIYIARHMKKIWSTETMQRYWGKEVTYFLWKGYSLYFTWRTLIK